MLTKIGEIAETVPVVGASTKCEAVSELFTRNPRLEGIVVAVENGSPQLMMRIHFYQQIGTRYGFTLYMNRPVSELANRNPLLVDESEPITEVSLKAMNRPDEQLYDLVLVMRGARLSGVVSVRLLLLSVAEVRTQMATFMNPLTGLPGNRIIEDRLRQMLGLEKFSVLYLDLDHFKSYNDSYGFKQGDLLIQSTANLLSGLFAGRSDTFLGHIGGDDYIAVLHHHEYEISCAQAIARFEQMKREFYRAEDLLRGFVTGENRAGVYEPIPLVSLSIAVVTNRMRSYDSIDEIVEEAARIKKRCKAVPGSIVFADNETAVCSNF
ncbi:GGDEF domain-containing protein [Saccharibacillus sp. CPCC 101409]|uniref:GGDEF domain-containing protein n=1 Tax=Saccharibacillus sp. CPCC 101409 TaxID=3058041 RepID=UPI002673F0E9|nr:GGDEF domain-containing protein [Saccharibacillus sp. CPCC 101409]MDO3412548.1 GGDEF domain-containing protein [Saccharibacillus sp. CPCC 101409]